MWHRLAGIIIRYRLTLALVMALLTILMGYFSTKTEMAYELQKIIPEKDSANIVYEKFKETFGEDGSVMVIGVQSQELFQQSFFNDWMQFTNNIDSLANVEKIISVTRLYDLTKDAETGLFKVKPICDRLVDNQAELEEIKAKIEQLPFYQDYLVNLKTGATLIAVTLDPTGVNTSRRVEIVEEIERLGSIFEQKHQVELHYSGVPYIRTVNTKKISNELLLFTLLSVVITCLFLLIFFKSFEIVLSSLFIVIISLLFTFGGMYLMGFKIGILTALIPPLIVVIAIQNCIYLLNIYHFEVRLHGNKIRALSRTIAKVGLASALTNATTAIGFGVFAFTGSNLLAEFGTLAAVNIMVVYVLCIILVPTIYSYLPTPSVKHLQHLDRKTLSGVLSFVREVVFNHRKWVYAASIMIVLISTIGAFKVNTTGFILDGISPKDKLYTDLKFFEKEFQGLFPFEILIDSKEADNLKDLRTLQKIEILNKHLRQIDQLSAPLAITEFLKFANQAYYGGNPKRYILPNPLDLGKIISMLPQNMNEGNSELMKSIVDSNFQITRISLKIADVGTDEHIKIRKNVEEKVAEIFPTDQFEVHVTGKAVVHVKGNGYLIENLIQGLVLAFIIISLLMALLFGSYKMIGIALLPNLIPLFMTLGLMGYSSINLKESTILIFSVAFGIVVDLTIHYLAKYRFELKRQNGNITLAVLNSIEQSGFSMIYTTVILFFGFIIFAFSSFEGTVYLGLLTSLSLLFGLLSNLFLLPSLLLGMEKRMNLKKESLQQSVLDLNEED